MNVLIFVDFGRISSDEKFFLLINFPPIKFTHAKNFLNKQKTRMQFIKSVFHWTLSQTRFVYYLAILYFFFHSTWVCFRIFWDRRIFASEFANVQCSRVQKPENFQPFPNLKESQRPTYCKQPKNQTFSKFLWFVSDGLPVKYSRKTLEFYKDHSVLFSVDVPGPKYSHAIYTR